MADFNQDPSVPIALEDIPLGERMQKVLRGEVLPQPRSPWNMTLPQATQKGVEGLLDLGRLPQKAWEGYWDFTTTPADGDDNALVADIKDALQGAGAATESALEKVGYPMEVYGDLVKSGAEKMLHTRDELEFKKVLDNVAAMKAGQDEFDDLYGGLDDEQRRLVQGLMGGQQATTGQGGRGNPLAGVPSGGGGANPLSSIPAINSGGVDPRYAQLRELLSLTKPGDAPEGTEEGMDEAIYDGLLAGVASLDGTQGIGGSLLQLALGTRQGKQNYAKMVREEKANHAKAYDDYVKEAIDLEKDIMKQQFDQSKAMMPKVYNTKNGVLVQQNVARGDGTVQSTFTPFNMTPYKQGQQVSALAGAFGVDAGDVSNVYGQKYKYDPSAPFGEELLILGQLDSLNALQGLEQELGLEDLYNEIIIETQTLMAGEKDKDIAERIRQRKTATLAQFLRESPAAKTKALKVINDFYGNPEVLEEEGQGDYAPITVPPLSDVVGQMDADLETMGQ